MNPDLALEPLILQAKEGDKKALESLIIAVQSQVYNLALRMLQSPMDAEDACQEILIKVITHLSEFRGESAFTTWVYRIAANYLLNSSHKRARDTQFTFTDLGTRLEQSLAQSGSDVAEQYDQRLLGEEVRCSCTLGMLLCLDRDQRIALILGEMFAVSSEEGAYILAISPAAFRKRLSRARAALVAFVSNTCGIVNTANPCRCEKHINNKIRAGRLDPNHLVYAGGDAASEQQYFLAQSQELNELCRTTALMRAFPRYGASDQFINSMRSWITNPQSHLFENAASHV